jgi:hypothetical protein
LINRFAESGFFGIAPARLARGDGLRDICAKSVGVKHKTIKNKLILLFIFFWRRAAFKFEHFISNK